MSLNISNYTDSTFSSILLNRIKFGIFLVLQVPSMSCSLYLFSQYATRQNLRQSIYNDIVVVQLYNNFVFVAVALPASEAFFFVSHVYPSRDIYCAFWTWIHYSLDVSNLILMTFACAERHWLLFRLNPMPSRRSRLLFHYIPISSCILYPWLFYFVFIFLYSCESTYDYTQLLCAIPCYFLSNTVANIDTFTNNWIPIAAIPVFSGALLIRFLLQKRRAQMEVFRWKRDRRMIIQLVSTSSLYFLMLAPLQAMTVYDNIALDGAVPAYLVDYLYILPYFIHLLYPFVILFSNSELQCRRRVVPPREHHQRQGVNVVPVNRL